MASIALSVTNAILGLANIGIGIGFSVEEQKKVDELNSKADKLKKDVQKAGDIYDHTYYLVTENLKRVKHAVDALPDDFLDRVETDIQDAIKTTEAEKVISTLGRVLGYTGVGMSSLSAIIKVVRAIKAKRAASREPEPTIDTDEENPWRELPFHPETLPENETLGASKMFNRFTTGLDVANTIFSVGALAVTIGLGVWTIEKLNKAMDAVDDKQNDITKFQKAMTDVLDQLVTCAGLPAKSYDQLQNMAKSWKTISEHCEGYSKALKFAIEYYFLGKSIDEIKKKVKEISDEGLKAFPEDAYPLAKTLADGIRDLFTEGKTDKEIVAFYATDNPKLSLRFVLDEFFVATLRSLKDL